jgi:hypothetical protein
MEYQNFVVTGNTVLNWWSKNPKVKFYWSDEDYNKFYITRQDIEPAQYYEFDFENGEVEVIMVEIINSIPELNDWL